MGWNIGQLASTPSTTSPPLTTTPADGSSVSTNPSITSSDTAQTSSPNTSSAGLSTGAKAGIGVGVALGVLGFIALLAAVFLLRRRNQKSVNTDGRAEQPYIVKPELSGEGTQRAEMTENYGKRPTGQPAPLYELATEERPSELNDTSAFATYR